MVGMGEGIAVMDIGLGDAAVWWTAVIAALMGRGGWVQWGLDHFTGGGCVMMVDP